MKLKLEYDREITVEPSDRGIRFTYYQFSKETFKQDLTEEEATLFASAIRTALGQEEPAKPIEKKIE
jgi:hypothetical protein